MPAETLDTILPRLEKEITKAFRALADGLIKESGDDLVMVGIATSSGLDYLAPVAAYHSRIENADQKTRHEIFGESLYEHESAPDGTFARADKLMSALFGFEEEPGYYSRLYETILSGMENAKAADLVKDAEGNPFAVVAMVTGGFDWGIKSVIARLNSDGLAESIFPTPSWLKDGTASYAGPKSSWSSTWGGNAIGRVSDDQLVFASYEKLYMFDLAKAEVEEIGESHSGNGFTAIGLTRKRDRLIGVTQYGVECYSIPDYKRVWGLKIEYRTASISIAPSGDRFVAGSIDGPATVWDTQDGRMLGELVHSSEDAWVMGCAWHPAGDLIATSGRDLSIRLWDSKSLKLIEEIPNGGDSIEFLPDGDFLAVGSGYSKFDSDRIRLLNMEDRSWTRFDPIQKGIVNRLRISEDGQLFAAFTDMLSSSIEIFRRDGRRVASLDVRREVNDALFLDDRSILLGGDWGEPAAPFIHWNFL